MAGTYFHFWLAHRAYSELFPSDSNWKAKRAAFFAGSVAPDLGFFPGGPRRFSERLHHEQTGDFLRALRDRVQDDLEWAFVSGWALHLYTDIALHPWVNSQVDVLLGNLSGPFSGRRDLWHLRLENGIDCDLLSRDELGFLWDVDIQFPRRQADCEILIQVGKIFFAGDVREAQVRQGMESQKKWVRRLPMIFLWTGNVRPASPKSGIYPFGRLVKPLVGKILGDWLGRVQRWENMAALARPLWPQPAKLSWAEKLGIEALSAFKAGFCEGFDSFENMDLDSGVLTA